MKLAQIPLYLLMLLAFCGNSNGLWLAASFLGNPHHFNASLWWSVAANVSKHRSKIQLHAFNNSFNSGSSGSGSLVKWNVLTKLCLDWCNTSFHLVYCNHESISTTGTSFNNLNCRSWASSFHFSISWTIGSLLSLPWSLSDSESPNSSPTSRTMAWLAGLSCCL